MKELSLQEVEDILVGCTILSTGGGGSLDEGLAAVRSAYETGHKVKLLDFSEIKDDSYYINPYFCGCLKPADEEENAVDANKKNELILAVEALEEYLQVTFEAFISIEYGGGNTGNALASAALMGRPVLDADAAGRAVPELQFSTYYVTDKPIYPFSVATKYGDTAVITKVADDARAEALARYMAMGSDDMVGMADHPIKGVDVRTSVIPSALSYAGSVGKAQREAYANKKNPLEEIVQVANGKLLFTGTVIEEGTSFAVRDGFTHGFVNIEGDDTYTGDTFKYYYKNENMVAWKNGIPYLTCPDLICAVDKESGYPITNPNFKPGMKIAVIGFPIHDIWKSGKGLEILNPKFFGYDLEPIYVKDII